MRGFPGGAQTPLFQTPQLESQGSVVLLEMLLETGTLGTKHSGLLAPLKPKFLLDPLLVKLLGSQNMTKHGNAFLAIQRKGQVWNVPERKLVHACSTSLVWNFENKTALDINMSVCLFTRPRIIEHILHVGTILVSGKKNIPCLRKLTNEEGRQ